MLYLIDAYNWLLRSSDREHLTSKDLENWTIWAADLLESFTRRSLLIFDGTKSPDSLRRFHVKHLEVIYTTCGQTADEYILEYLSAVRSKTCTVVTSDRQLARSAKELGAETVPVASFARLLIGKKRARHIAATGNLSFDKIANVEKSHQIAPPYSATWSRRDELIYLQKVFERRYSRTLKKNS